MLLVKNIHSQLFGKHSMAEFEKLFISLSEIKGKHTYSNSELSNHALLTLKEILNQKDLKVLIVLITLIIFVAPIVLIQ